LTAIDIVVNRKRQELKINYPDEKKETNLPFERRYGELIDEMKKKGVAVSDVLRPLSEAFWDMRTKITHYGATPRPKELQLIIEYSKEIIKMLSFQIKTK